MHERGIGNVLASKWDCKIFAMSKHNLFSKETQKEVCDGIQRMCERNVGSLVPQDR